MWLPFRFRHRRRSSRLRRRLVWALRLGLLLIALDVLYLIQIWPDWQAFTPDRMGKSNFMQDYERRRQQDKTLPPLRWKPVPLNWIPKTVQRAVIVAEDARFYEHHGFDVIAFQEAMRYNLENRRLRYGASTLSQQTVKNLYFSSSRNPLRKWHELVVTLGMEFNLSKDRILNTYLNIAEFGKGVYGVQAAAQYYWGLGVYSLNRWQAAQLAATLPSPIKHNPRTRTSSFLRRARRIYRRM